MTWPKSISLAKMSPPTDGEINDNRGDDTGDIDRWENDGGMSFGTVHDRSRNQKSNGCGVFLSSIN